MATRRASLRSMRRLGIIFRDKTQLYRSVYNGLPGPGRLIVGVDTDSELLCTGNERVVGSGIGTDTLRKFDGPF